MSDYTPPLADMRFVLTALAHIDELAALPGFEEASPDLVDAILEQSGRFHQDIIAPLNRAGDLQGARIADREVATPEGFAEAYARFVDSGWGSLGLDTAHGGQGLPQALASAVMEMTQSAGLAFSLCTLLTQTAARTLAALGDDALTKIYLPNMVSGEWTGTMNLTEPQAGSDLAAINCRAEAAGDHYLLRGQKIFITWGDHAMTPNIVHLVLARPADAPPGSAGLSLFLVPKYLPDGDGVPGPRNDVYPVSVEHKLGIHGSPTCVMQYGADSGAVGYLVGELNRGLPHMFTMMNEARLDVGLQGLAISERAYQQAREFARERVQGGDGRSTIIAHPDVRRMLMLMRAGCEAMRAVIYTTRAQQDCARRHPDPALAEASAARVELMTPIVKGWCTELANELTSLGIQVHGGMGYIEETGAAQHYRDARILAIYEGTNGIQALDLVGRKLIRDGGDAMAELLADMDATRRTLVTAAEQSAAGGELALIGDHLAAAIDALREATGWIEMHREQEDATGAVAFDLLMLAGYCCGGWQMARAATLAAGRLEKSDGNGDFYRNKLATARFYAEHYLPRTAMHLAAVRAGADATMALSDADF